MKWKSRVLVTLMEDIKNALKPLLGKHWQEETTCDTQQCIENIKMDLNRNKIC
jgi:hypothetical protein